MYTEKEWLTIGINEINEGLFNPIINRRGFVKPNGGLWASPYTPNKEFLSSWHEWCNYEMPHWIGEYGVVFKLKSSSKICVIDSLADLKSIHGLGYETVEDIGGFYKTRNLDFEKLSRDYDAIYLTEKGANQTYWGESGLSGINLYGWDVESLLILNFNCIESWKEIKIK